MELDGKHLSRREFLQRSGKLTATVAAASALSFPLAGSVRGANEQINLACVGIHGRGGGLMKDLAGMEGVRIHTICDIDERLWPKAVKSIKDKQGHEPKTHYDMRKVFEDKEIDAAVIAVPNHWHALATIWACQAGKHVYVEKPACHNIFEGRKMVEAARKYQRLVQVGFQNRSFTTTRAAMQMLHDGKLGKIYMARGLCFKPRDSFGKFPDSAVPEGVHWDIFLGPAPYRPFNEGRFHYNWHWHWDTGNGDTGNQGPHQFDVARWGLNKANEQPVRIKSIGGYFKFQDVCSQETPNTQTTVYEYADGTLLEFGTRGLYTNPESEQKIGVIFLGTEGWMEIDAGGNWKTYLGRSNKPGPDSKNLGSSGYDPTNLTSPGGGGHLENFIAALRSGKQSDLSCDVEVGHLSTCLPHLANISYRLGREVIFDGAKEKFVGDEEADRMLTRDYRKPYVVPENV
ncbi:MAG: Gfo/Idh/MocA family oxidoreductase [Sedimentisphaerales bacterium]|nr:Gfo/Idh/MocA family oxidoreductase [Sedimentisphaerales bacterium]